MTKQLLLELEDSDIPLLSRSQLQFLEHVNSAIDEEGKNYTWSASAASPISPESGNHFTEKVSVIESNFRIIIKSLKSARSARETFVEVYPKWKKVREDSIVKLQEIADSINLDRFNCNVSKLVGYSTSIVGGVLTVASAFLIPFTMGLSTPLSIAGGSIFAAGTSTAIGTSVTEVVLLKKKTTRAQEIMLEDKEYFEKMSDWLVHVRHLEEAINAVMSIDIAASVVKGAQNFVDDARAQNTAGEPQRYRQILNGIRELYNLFPRGILLEIPPGVVGMFMFILIAFNLLLRHSSDRLVFDSALLSIKGFLGITALLDDSMDLMRLSSLFAGANVAAKDIAKAVTRGAFGAVGIALDVTAIILTSMDVHNGSVSPEAVQIADACKGMREEADVLERVYANLNKRAL